MTRLQRSLAITALISLLILGFFSCFEKKTVEVPTPSTLEAAQNPYLATSRLLEAMGHEVVTLDGVHSLDELPPLDATLVLTARRRELTERHSYAILDWVEKGGHLILRPQEVFSEDEEFPYAEDDPARPQVDRLLDPFGLRAFTTPEEEEESEQEEADSDSPEEQYEYPGEEFEPEMDEELAEELVEAVESWTGGPQNWDEASGNVGEAADLRLTFIPVHWGPVAEEAEFTVTGEDGVHLLSLAHGAGFVTAISDEWFLKNEYFDDYDHARAIVELARIGGRSGPVYILLSEDFPGLGSQVAKYAWPAAVSLVILVLGWLWRSAPRFGPIAPDPVSERREWIEHLEAVGDFHWRQNHASELIRSTRAGVLRLIETRHPVLARLSPRQRYTQIAETCGLHRVWVQHALDETEFPTAEATVARTIAHLERIRSSL